MGLFTDILVPYTLILLLGTEHWPGPLFTSKLASITLVCCHVLGMGTGPIL